MGRGRGGKGKKQAIIASNDDVEEEKLPSSNKRRGRPQKPLKDQVEDDQESEKTEDDKNPKSKDSAEVGIGKGRKRKKPTQDNADAIEEEKDDSEGGKHKSDSNGSFVRSVGFRPNGSRRKSKPCRAAEVGVKCK